MLQNLKKRHMENKQNSNLIKNKVSCNECRNFLFEMEGYFVGTMKCVCNKCKTEFSIKIEDSGGIYIGRSPPTNVEVIENRTKYG